MANFPLWSAIIPTYGSKGVALTQDCLRSLLHTTEKHEVIVVDDGSSPDIQEQMGQACDEWGATFVARSENGGFAKACNDGMKVSNGRVVILVNNDTLQIGKTLDSLANFLVFSGGATAGCKLLYKDHTVQHAGVCYVPGELHGFWDHVGRFESRWANYVCRIRRSLCTGAMLAINRYVLESVGFLDERYGMAVEDIDIQMRCIESGFSTFYCGIIEAYHLEGQTRGRTPQEKAKYKDWTEAEERGMGLFFERWKGVNFSQFQIGAETFR